MPSNAMMFVRSVAVLRPIHGARRFAGRAQYNKAAGPQTAYRREPAAVAGAATCIRRERRQGGGPSALAARWRGGRGGIIDGDTLVLQDGREVRLDGCGRPSAARRPDCRPAAAEAAKEVLGALALGIGCGSVYGGARTGTVARSPRSTRAGVWMQGAMIERGSPAPDLADTRARARDAGARAARARRGAACGATRATASLSEATRPHIDGFQLVEGRVGGRRAAGQRTI